MLNIITNGYVLPFISKPILVRFPLIQSEYKALQKDQALATCIQSLLMALSRGLRLHQYLDDWLIRSQSQEEAQVNTKAVVDLTQSLGWIINQEKSELKPTQVFSWWSDREKRLHINVLELKAVSLAL